MVSISTKMKDEIMCNNELLDCKPEQADIPFQLFQYLSSKEPNLQSLCRICLTSTDDDASISLLSTYENETFIDILKLFTSIQIRSEDGLPSSICFACQSDVIRCYKFKVKCERSDYILQTLLQEQYILKEEYTNNNSNDEPHITSPDHLENFKGDTEQDMKVQYLNDDLFTSEDETLCIVQNTGNEIKDELEITVTDSQSLLEEVLIHKSPEKLKSCNFCLKKFSKVKNLRAHIRRKHSSEIDSHPCTQCKEIFSSPHDLHVHSAVHSSGPLWSCNTCQKVFKAKQKLRRHILRHMQAKRFACDSCGKTFSELYALRRHARVHTGEAIDKKYACHICDKRYSESSSLALHVAGHKGERPCVCAVCGKAFATTRLLRSHRRVHSDAKPYPCRYCDKRFRHESTRNTHHRTHTGEKPYVCATCGKTFIQNSNLTLHMRTHTGEKPYSCNKCDLKFTSGSALKAHQKRHSGEKPYSCDICGKKFARMDLSAHKRLHTGARPHACSACPKTFVNAARLRNHCRIHTGEKPFECATCAKTFSAKSHLAQHVKKHQGNMKQEDDNVVIVQHVAYSGEVFLSDIISDGKPMEQVTGTTAITNDNCEDSKDNITLELAQDVPLDVSNELVVQDDCEVKEILVVDNSQNNANYQSANVCLDTTGVNYANSDVNLVTVNEGTTVKLYQLDQSLVQIHSSGRQLTISKITSKMTANF